MLIGLVVKQFQLCRYYAKILCWSFDHFNDPAWPAYLCRVGNRPVVDPPASGFISGGQPPGAILTLPGNSFVCVLWFALH